MRATGKVFLFFLFIQLTGFAQTDSLIFTSDMRIEDGLYLSYTDFRNNKSISSDQIISKQDKEQLEFITKTLANESFSVNLGGTISKYISKDVWGYFQNNTFYINYKGDFYRVPVFGSISYLVAYVTVVSPGFYDPRYALSSPASTSKELREFLMNFYEGIMIEFTMKAAEELLSRDAALFEEYDKLSSRKKKDEIYRYIRKFNQSHPIYFLK